MWLSIRVAALRPALSVFRVPNAIYSAPLYFLLGFAMNLDFRKYREGGAGKASTG